MKPQRGSGVSRSVRRITVAAIAVLAVSACRGASETETTIAVRDHARGRTCDNGNRKDRGHFHGCIPVDVDEADADAGAADSLAEQSQDIVADVSPVVAADAGLSESSPAAAGDCPGGAYSSWFFWASKRGLRLVTDDDLARFGQSTYTQLREWFETGDRLQVEFGLMSLAVENGFADGSDRIYVASFGVVNIGWLVSWPFVCHEDCESIQAALHSANCSLVEVETATAWPETTEGP